VSGYAKFSAPGVDNYAQGDECHGLNFCSFSLTAPIPSGERVYGVCTAVAGKFHSFAVPGTTEDLATDQCHASLFSIKPCRGSLLSRGLAGDSGVFSGCRIPSEFRCRRGDRNCHVKKGEPELPKPTTPPPTPHPVSCVAEPSACASLEVSVAGVPTTDPLNGFPLATGYGDVSASPPDQILRCPFGTDYRACLGSVELPIGTRVTLSAVPDPTNGSYDAGWSGDGAFNCRASSPTCVVTVGKVSRVTALFGAAIYKLTIDNTQNPNAGQVVPSGFSNLGPTFERIACGLGVNDCTAYYPLVDSHTIPNFNGPEPLSLAQNGVITEDNQQWYIQFLSGCDSVQVVVDGSNRYTVCYYHMTADRTVTVRWTDTPP
jgi:hypothetical protein